MKNVKKTNNNESDFIFKQALIIKCENGWILELQTENGSNTFVYEHFSQVINSFLETPIETQQTEKGDLL